MPPKARLHRVTGKPTKIPQKSVEQPSTSVGLSPELEQQFEVELCWCIQQLQLALKSGKLNNKQVQDHTKTLNTLMSNSTPLVKKRQVMRLSFGDYRAKMAAEDKKLSRNATNIKVVPGNPSKKSVFIKKSAFCTGNNFKFNFNIPKDNISEELESIKLQDDEVAKDKNQDVKPCFTPSDNSFRFNFGIENDT
ncbi:UPF0488 protein CG14286 isoform X2 [Aethina tumida]|nr:UPF0488 protein CG14286 isoform X2 [Aethina tumida]